MTKAIHSSETPSLIRATLRNIQEHGILYYEYFICYVFCLLYYKFCRTIEYNKETNPLTLIPRANYTD
jgi:hypothetical protein